MSEWKEVRLGDIVTVKSGYAYKGKYISNKGKNILLGMGCVSYNDKFLYSGARAYDEDCDERYCAKAGDIVLATRQQSDSLPILAMPAIIPDSFFDKKIIVGTNLYLIKNDSDIDNHFLFWLLKTPNYVNYISSVKTGTTVRMVTKKDVENYTFNCPSKEERDTISNILWGIDAKIETNNKLNEKLEEMAQAIFKSWFVDFEPFKDKPFHETELGMIPEGWEVSTFSSIIEKLISGDWGKETPTGNYVHKVACIRGCDFENIKNGLRGKTPERFILERNFALKQPKPNDIVVEMSGGTATVSTGRICYITKELLDQYEGDIVCTNFCKIVRPLKGWSQYLYYYWQYKYDKKVMFCYENGTSGIKNFAINDFIDFESILIPPKDELIKFNSIIDNIRVKIQMNGVENTRLASLRDTLLPRLMSGELIV